MTRSTAESGRRISSGSVEWPRRVDDDPDPPTVLYLDGCAPDDRSRSRPRPAVAIVGTRRSTAAGDAFAFDLGAALCRLGVDVVSGLAAGIDGAAHAGVVQCRQTAGSSDPELGRAIAVVGCGVDVVYPSRHRELWHAVARNGLVMSEHPNGTRPRKWHFPRRNRLIAALADVVVVVESASTGGALGTVDAALERNRPILAVPGPVQAPSSAGCLDLLADGAQMCRGVDDVISLLALTTGWVHPNPGRGVEQATLFTSAGGNAEPSGSGAAGSGSGAARSGTGAAGSGSGAAGSGSGVDALRSALAHGPRTPDELAALLGCSATDIAVAIAHAELAGVVRSLGTYVEVVR